jgi:hypothetical protein
MVGGCIHASRVGSDAFCIAGLHLLLEDGLAGKNTVGNFFLGLGPVGDSLRRGEGWVVQQIRLTRGET